MGSVGKYTIYKEKIMSILKNIRMIKKMTGNHIFVNGKVHNKLSVLRALSKELQKENEVKETIRMGLLHYKTNY